MRIEKMKIELSLTVKEELRRKIEELEQLIEDREKENSELKKTYNNSVINEKELLNKLKSYETMDEEYKLKINKLEVKIVNTRMIRSY
jgi:hypothetical protein